MDPESMIPPWREVRAAAERYDEALVGEVARATLVGDDGVAREAPQGVLDARIREAVGAWYGRAGWRVGNESFGSCWCHSPVVRLSRVERGQQRATPDEAVAWVVGEVRSLVFCLRAFAAVYDAVERGAVGEARARAVAAALGGVFDAVIEETGCSESWYRYAGDGAVWLCDHLGVERGTLETLVEQSVFSVCSSWTAPSPPARAAALDVVAARIAGLPLEAPSAPAERVSRILQPRRARAAEARAAVEGLEAVGALEALVARGLLGEGWLDASPRAFTTFDDKAVIKPPRDVAADPAVYAALAADAEGVARAEALAWELAHRLRAWGMRAAPRRLVWCLERDVEGYAYHPMVRGYDALDRVAAAAERMSSASDARVDAEAHARALATALPVGADVEALRARCVEAAREVHTALFALDARLRYEAGTIARYWNASLWWAILAEAGARVPDSGASAALGMYPGSPQSIARFATAGAPLRDLPDPLAALVALWDTGYAVHAIDDKARTITLLVPKMP